MCLHSSAGVSEALIIQDPAVWVGAALLSG